MRRTLGGPEHHRTPMFGLGVQPRLPSGYGDGQALPSHARGGSWPGPDGPAEVGGASKGESSSPSKPQEASTGGKVCEEGQPPETTAPTRWAGTPLTPTQVAAGSTPFYSDLRNKVLPGQAGVEEVVHDVSTLIKQTLIPLEDESAGDGIPITPPDMVAWQAVRVGNLQRLGRALACGADANFSSFSRSRASLLHVACSRGWASCACRLLESGARPTATDANGQTPFDLARCRLELRFLVEIMEKMVSTPVVADGVAVKDFAWRGPQWEAQDEQCRLLELHASKHERHDCYLEALRQGRQLMVRGEFGRAVAAFQGGLAFVEPQLDLQAEPEPEPEPEPELGEPMAGLSPDPEVLEQVVPELKTAAKGKQAKSKLNKSELAKMVIPPNMDQYRRQHGGLRRTCSRDIQLQIKARTSHDLPPLEMLQGQRARWKVVIEDLHANLSVTFFPDTTQNAGGATTVLEGDGGPSSLRDDLGVPVAKLVVGKPDSHRGGQRSGTFTGPSAGQLVLTIDNSFSKLSSKTCNCLIEIIEEDAGSLARLPETDRADEASSSYAGSYLRLNDQGTLCRCPTLCPAPRMGMYTQCYRAERGA